MVSLQCDMDTEVYNSDNSANASSGGCSSCHTTEPLWITAMNPPASSLEAEVPEETAAAADPLVASGASKSLSKKGITTADEDLLLLASGVALSYNHTTDRDCCSSMSSLPLVSSSTLSFYRSGVMQDHPEKIERAVSDGRNNNKTRRVRKRLLSSSCSIRRNNYYTCGNSILPVILMSLCCIGFAAANVFSAEATSSSSSGSTASIVTTVAPQNTTMTTSSSLFGGDDTTATKATITTTITPTTTIGGLKLIEDEAPLCFTFNKGQCQNNSQYCAWNTDLWSCDYTFIDTGDRTGLLAPCTTFNKGQCQQNSLCTWITTLGICDYNHLPVTSSSPPTTMNPSSSISPSLQGTNPVTGPTGGNKVITETPTTLQPSPLPTKLPTPLPTKLPTPLPTKLPTPLPTNVPTSFPTNVPTTRPPTNMPTGKPTTKEPTVEPTDLPTVSPTFRPTRKPTPKPTNMPTPRPSPKPSPVPSMSPTWSPSVSPSASPTASPSDFPSTTPTAFPTISPKPTPLVWPSASPTISSMPTISPSHRPSSSPTVSPSVSPTEFPTTASPIAADETKSPVGTTTPNPTAPPTPPPSSSLQRRVLIEDEPTSITLKNAYKMDRSSAAYMAWEESTKERIAAFTQELIEEVTGEKGVVVTVTISDVVQRGDSKTDGRRRLQRRVLQEEGGGGGGGPLNPLRLSFRTTLEFYSIQSKWDGDKLIAAGFITPSQQKEYISELQRRERDSFGAVEGMVMSVNGQVITVSTDDNKNITTSNTLTYIIAGVVSGVLVLFAVGGGVYYVKRNNRRNSGFVDHKGGFSGKYPDKKSPTSSNFYNGSGNTGTMMSSPPNNSFPPPPPQSSSPVGDYFGTIEPRPGEDDVSTLGDPYIGDVNVNQAMGGDNTVTESLMSSDNDMYVYGIARPRLPTGDSSRMGGSTVHTPGGNRMTFQDDGTIEEFYGRPDSTNFHSEKDSDFEHITVVASSGVLGIVIDNPTRTTPVVHAIKETSILNGRVHVGDLLMSVDEVDCRGMTAVAVSRLIGSRSQNPTRTLRLLRGATLADVRGDSSHIPY